MANAREQLDLDWLHRAVTAWTEMASGESRTLRAPIGGYLLVRSGEVHLAATHAEHRSLEGPAKAPVGGGQITVRAETDAEVAIGSVKTHVGVVIDVDAGYATDLWEILGRNASKRERTSYLSR